MDKTKAEAAAYAPEIELLTRAMMGLLNAVATHGLSVAPLVPMGDEIQRRLRVLLDLEEGK
jgi:hypothetical protein